MLFLLDIDGVMVPAKGWKSPEFLKDGFPAFSTRATRTLQKVVSDSDTVVLTTSHKAKFSIEDWKELFKSRGLNFRNIKSLPENNAHLSRKDEIVSWFNLNVIDEEFVILDDDKSLNDLPVFLKENLVQTSSFIGLTEEHIEVIESISRKRLNTV